MARDRERFLKAIRAAPDDDAVRLVYADWLDENGDEEHAELIRVQCRLPRLPRRSTDLKRLARRAGELEQVLTSRLGVPPGVGLTWQRGFVGQIQTGVVNYLDFARRVAEYAPAVELLFDFDHRDYDELERLEQVDFEEWERVFERLAACPHLAACHTLDLARYCPGIQPMWNLLHSPHLTNVGRLNAPDNEAGPAVEVIASATFANLTWANFRNSDSASDYPRLRALVTCRHLANLEYLDFGENDQKDEDLGALASTPHMTRLRHLSVSVSRFTVEAVRLLGEARNLPALTELDLTAAFGPFNRGDNPGQGDAHLRALVSSPLLEQLTHLGLARNGISDAGANALAAAPRRLRLRFLDLSRNPISARARRALRRRFGEKVCIFGDD
jgi:uncharacterized protein (TIGR02996 family)